MNSKSEPTHRSESLAYLTFNLDEQRYALPIEQVVEVAVMVALDTMPDTPPAVLGVANRHGAVLPMLDLRLVFGKPAPPLTSSTLFIVAAYNDQIVGLVVDEVNQVEYLQPHDSQRRVGSQRYVEQIISQRDMLIQVVALAAVVDDYFAREMDAR